ncbi:MAG: DoxX family protein [Nakamurella sp.]
MTTLVFGSTNTSTRQSARQNIALLIARVALGVVLIAHGWQKFFTFGISGVTASFEQMGIPFAGAAAIFAAMVELVGGILLIVGLAVPLVGLLVAIDMIGALLLAHATNGVFVETGGFELVLVIAALGVVFAGIGAGGYALDRLFAGNKRVGANA